MKTIQGVSKFKYVAVSSLAVIVLTALALSGCKSRTLNADADTESLADKTHVLGVVENADKSLSFQICQRSPSGVAIQASCQNPFLDREGQPGRFTLLPNNKTNLALVGQGKAVAMVVGGGVVVAVGIVGGAAAGAYLGLGAAHVLMAGSGNLVTGLFAFVGLQAAGGALGAGAGGAGAAMWMAKANQKLWGYEERELSKNFDEIYNKNSLDNPALVQDVKKLLPLVANSLGFKLRS